MDLQTHQNHKARHANKMSAFAEAGEDAWNTEVNELGFDTEHVKSDVSLMQEEDLSPVVNKRKAAMDNDADADDEDADEPATKKSKKVEADGDKTKKRKIEDADEAPPSKKAATTAAGGAKKAAVGGAKKATTEGPAECGAKKATTAEGGAGAALSRARANLRKAWDEEN